MRLSTFRTVVTPPFGHSLCGGWILPAQYVTTALYAQGIVLQDDAQAPVVLCAVDWCEIRAADHVLWRQTIAAAVGTDPERVAVQCVHQHNAPIVDQLAQSLTTPHGMPDFADEAWTASCAGQVARFAQDSMRKAREVTDIGVGQAPVDRVASNRRVHKVDGKLVEMRFSSCTDPELREMEEGQIDPMLKAISFWSESEKLACLHYYATHPMSYYYDGLVNHDFVGIARERLTAEDGALHIYFTGCAGDISAGKYNDGSVEARPMLAERIYQGMLAAEAAAKRSPQAGFSWQTENVALPPGPQFEEESLLATIADSGLGDDFRKHAAMALVHLRWVREGKTTPLTSLRLGDDIRIIHLPGEPFIDYQLYVQESYPEKFIAVAGYGDGIPGYIPLAESFAEGGYEIRTSYVAPDVEQELKQVLMTLAD